MSVVILVPITAWCLIAFLSGYFINSYARNNVKLYVKIIVWLGWMIGFSIIVLLPSDLYINYVIDKREQYHTVLYLIWRLNYWIAFLLCFFVFPMLGEYVVAGDFTVKGKLYTALVQNLVFY